MKLHFTMMFAYVDLFTITATTLIIRSALSSVLLPLLNTLSRSLPLLSYLALILRHSRFAHDYLSPASFASYTFCVQSSLFYQCREHSTEISHSIECDSYGVFQNAAHTYYTWSNTTMILRLLNVFTIILQIYKILFL